SPSTQLLVTDHWMYSNFHVWLNRYSFMEKHVLLVTYSWPPDAGVGGVRAVNIVRAIEPLGWQATILTVQPKYYRYRQQMDGDDPALAGIVRTRCLPHPLEWYRIIKNAFLKGSHFP